MKTTSRTPRNGSAPRATKQASKKPESSAIKIAAVHQGTIKHLLPEMKVGIVTVPPDQAKVLDLNPDGDLFFWFDPLADKFHEGDKVSFTLKRETIVRLQAGSVQVAETANVNGVVDKESLEQLVGANNRTDDALWATREGRLYLWTGKLAETPRGVSLAEAREWWNKFQKDEPYLSAPFFPEETDAAEFTTMVCRAMNERKEQPAAVGTAASADSPVISEPSKGIYVPDFSARFLADSLRLLQLKANAAKALALLNTDRMEHDMGSYEGWESLDVPDFNGGNHELARSLASRLDAHIEQFEDDWKPTIERLRGFNTPVKAVKLGIETRSATLKALRVGEDFNSRIELENAVSGLKGLVILQATVMSMTKRKCEVWHAASFIADELWDAFENVFQAAHQLAEAAIALEFRQREAQRQAA